MNRIRNWLSRPEVRGRLLALPWALLLFGSMYASASAQAGGGSGGGTSLGDALAILAKMLVDGLIALAALLLAIGLATNFVTGMAETIAGRPTALSSTWIKIGGIIVAFVGAIFTIQIANTIIDTLKAYKGNDTIHLP